MNEKSKKTREKAPFPAKPSKVEENEEIERAQSKLKVNLRTDNNQNSPKTSKKTGVIEEKGGGRGTKKLASNKSVHTNTTHTVQPLDNTVLEDKDTDTLDFDADTTTEEELHEHFYADTNLKVSELKISSGRCDKLAITFDVPAPSKEESASEHIEAVVRGDKSGCVLRQKATKAYNGRLSIMADDKTIADLQWNPRRKNIRTFRFEYNPAKLNQSEQRVLIAALKKLFGPDFQKHFASANITRLDPMFSVRPAEVSRLLVVPGKPKKSLHYGIAMNAGDFQHFWAESQYMGSEKSDRFCRVYDKSIHMFEVKGKLIAPHTVRVEGRLNPRHKGKSISVSLLKKANNPFEAIHMYYIPTSDKKVEGLFKLVTLASRQVGWTAAMNLLPDSRKRQEINEIASQWTIEQFEPKKIWRQVLKHLEASGLFPKNTFVTLKSNR